jgi:uncharacterized protein (TIGR03067 family)
MSGVLLLTMLTIAAPDRPDRSPTDIRPLQERLVGQWQLVNSVISGQPQDPSTFPATVYTFTPDKLVTRSAKQPDGVTFGVVLDITRAPAHITFLAGSTDPKTPYPGIFKIDGDTLTLCFTRSPSGQRPPEFNSPMDTQQAVALFQFKRVGK